MTSEAFGQYWKSTHGPVAGVAEPYFDTLETLQAGLGSPAGKATLEDLPNFLDMTRSGMFLVNEGNVI